MSDEQPVGGASGGDTPIAARDPSINDATAPEAPPPSDKLNMAQVAGSMLAAGLGVQSSKNRERDFKQGRFGVFVAAGLIFTLLFIVGVYTVVQVVLKSSGH